MGSSKPSSSSALLRVLLVERNDLVVARTLRVLPDTIECIVARDVPDGLERLEEGTFAGAIVDLDLPGASGLLVAMREAHPSAAILVCGEPSAATRVAIASAEATHVDGPIEPSLLLELDAWIVTHRPWAPTRTGRFLAPRPPTRPTPGSIRRAAFRSMIGEPLARIPDVPDTIVCVGARAIEHPRATLHRIALEESGTFELLLGTVRNIAAVVVESPAAALDPAGFVAALRAERPDVPVLVLSSWIAPAVAEQLSLGGIALQQGDRPTLEARASDFVDTMLDEADLRRHVLDRRVLEWRLTNRETELTWLCSMISRRARVEQLFNGGGFRAQLESTRRKVGATTFEELCVIVRR